MARVLLLAFLLFPASSALALMPDPARTALEMDKEWVKANRAADLTALEELLSKDLVYIHSSSVTDTKESFIGHLKDGSLKYEDLRVISSHATALGTSAAVITGTLKIHARMSSREIQGVMRYTHVYQLERGRLRLLTHQSTLIPKALGNPKSP